MNELEMARDLYRRARATGFYPQDDLQVFADRLKTGAWSLDDVEFLVSDAEQQCVKFLVSAAEQQ